MDVVRLGEEHWQRLAHVRLRAVLGEPGLYGWALAREQGFGERHWRMRLRAAPWWVAVDDGADRGLVSLIAEPGAPAGERHLTALWVDPASRRRGAGRALVAAAAAQARADGAERLTAWVPEEDDASAFARGCGLTATGERVALPRDPARTEQRWTSALGG